MKYLGIDVGTGGSRSVVIDEFGNVIASATAEHAPFASQKTGWAEQDPDDWWRAAAESIRQVLGGDEIQSEEIEGVGFSGQMHGAVVLDQADRVIRPALIWCDQRTQAQCDWLHTEIGREKLIELVCNPALTNFTLPKLLWIRENEPENWERIATVMLPKDYVRFRMTGEKCTDVADGSGTLMLDVQNRKWSEDLLDAVDIDSSILPNLFESQEVTGRISESVANETGLKPGTPVVAGAGDNAAGAIGMGLTGVGSLGATIGTSGVVFAVTDQPLFDSKGRIHTLCHAIPERWHVTGVTQSAGLSLKWFRENLASEKSFEELSELAAGVEPGSEGLFWTPYLMGERTPHIDPDARAAFVGITARHGVAEMSRAVMEGVAFSLRDCMEVFKETGIPIESIRLGGGGAKSEVWRQIQADAYGKAVSLLKGEEEGAAHGAAILAGVGTGHWDSVDRSMRHPQSELLRLLNQTIKVRRRWGHNTKGSEKYTMHLRISNAVCSKNPESFMLRLDSGRLGLR